MKAAVIVPEDDFFVLSNLSPGPAQKRLALGVVLCISAVFILITSGLLSNIRPGEIDAFVPAYTAAMIVNDSITAVLLFAQFSILRSRAILVIASGYLFTALILIPWALTFPGLFAPTGLVGGLQSTSGLYFFWHVGFALFVVVYALTKDTDASKRFWQGTVRGSDHPECRLDLARGCGSGVYLHNRQWAVAPCNDRQLAILRRYGFTLLAHRSHCHRLPSLSCFGFGDIQCSIFG